MKHYLLLLALLFAAGTMAQPPQRQDIDVDETEEDIMNQRQMGNIEIVQATEEANKSLNSVLKSLSEPYVKMDEGGTITEFTVSPTVQKLKDRSLSISFPELASSYIGHDIKWLKKPQRFNPRKDDINNFYLVPMAGEYRVVMKNKRGKECDMSEFRLVPLNDRTFTSQTVEKHQYAWIKGDPEQYITRVIPTNGEVGLKYLPTGEQVNIPYSIRFGNHVDWQEKDGVFVAEQILVNGNVRYCHLTELRTGTTWYLTIPFTINANGRNGRDGRDGSNGISGMNTYSYTDKKGVKHTVKGTCGTAGGNGTNGENGTNGGHILVYLDKNLSQDVVTITNKAGKGGRGGSAGIGGTHGQGSGCTGRAPNGYPGRSGSGGKPGVSKVIRIIADPIRQMHAKYELSVTSPCLYIQFPEQKSRRMKKPEPIAQTLDTTSSEMKTEVKKFTLNHAESKPKKEVNTSESPAPAPRQTRIEPKKEVVKEKRVYEWEQFVLVNYAYGPGQHAFGLTYGRVKLFGWYANFMLGTGMNWIYQREGDPYITVSGERVYPFYTGKKSANQLELTAGGIVRVVIPLYIYFGTGYGYRSLTREISSGEWVKMVNWGDRTFSFGNGQSWAIGVQGNINGFTISAGFTYITNYHAGIPEGRIGLGYTFKVK